MESNRIEELYNRFKYGEDNFHNLMQFRVRNILLVSTIYDAYILEHDSVLSEKIVLQYHQLNLTTIPRITHISTGKEALALLQTEQFDLVITTMHMGEMTPFELTEEIKKGLPALTVLLLLTVRSDLSLLEAPLYKKNTVDKIFLWNGDAAIFLAMIKYTEDRENAQRDTQLGGVQTIILIEDSIRYYSYFLPILYKELMEQLQRLISEEVNDSQKYFRMKSRPKILLVSDYEEAITLIDKYNTSILSVISDAQFPLKGELNNTSGLKVLEYLKSQNMILSFLLQSSDLSNKDEAEKAQVPFIWKQSKTLQNDIGNYFLSSLGFGDFLFRDENGLKYGEAHSIEEFTKVIDSIPYESLHYHGNRNDFSKWLSAHGDFYSARILKEVSIDSFKGQNEVVQYLKEQFKKARERRVNGQIVSFNEDYLMTKGSISRIGAGSIGGKGRGLAFFNALLSGISSIDSHLSQIEIPNTIIIGTNAYDSFLYQNEILNLDFNSYSDQGIKELFLKAYLPEGLKKQLYKLIKQMLKPLAIRSSGLLEDSQTQPFAGIYETYFLPNTGEEQENFQQLCQAVKLVYSSVFLSNARSYLESVNLHFEDEKMAIIIQELVGKSYKGRFYPQLSGLAQSYNFYPISHMEPEDGVAQLALGFGHILAGGERAYFYCPKWPSIPFLDNEDLLKFSQRDFIYMKCDSPVKLELMEGEGSSLSKDSITTALNDGSLSKTTSKPNGVTPVLDFQPIIKYREYPLSELLLEILEIGEKSFGAPVEIEFALSSFEKEIPLSLLQIRPLNFNREKMLIGDLRQMNDAIWLKSELSQGNGIISQVEYVVLVHSESFDITQTAEIAREVEDFNHEVGLERKGKYILIGPGRWGSRDPFLGIPVQWKQICFCSAIVEHGIKNFDIEPSRGSHFLHNIISQNIGYFNIPYDSEESFIHMNWLRTQKVISSLKFTSLIQLSIPVKVIMDGSQRVSVITKN